MQPGTEANSVRAALLPDAVVHLDFKPDNVMIAADCSPKIIDFGLAKGLYDTEGKEVQYSRFHFKAG